MPAFGAIIYPGLVVEGPAAGCHFGGGGDSHGGIADIEKTDPTFPRYTEAQLDRLAYGTELVAYQCKVASYHRVIAQEMAENTGSLRSIVWQHHQGSTTVELVVSSLIKNIRNIEKYHNMVEFKPRFFHQITSLQFINNRCIGTDARVQYFYILGFHGTLNLPGKCVSKCVPRSFGKRIS